VATGCEGAGYRDHTTERRRRNLRNMMTGCIHRRPAPEGQGGLLFDG
jgi:hypothetical protein